MATADWLKKEAWVCQWRSIPQRNAPRKPMEVALTLTEAIIFIHLQQHYDFIVYLGYSLWRKLLFMWEHQSSLTKPHSLDIIVPSLLSIQDAGTFGIMHRPILKQIVSSDYRDSPVKSLDKRLLLWDDFQVLVMAAVENNQLDVVHLLLTTFHIELAEIDGDEGTLGVFGFGVYCALPAMAILLLRYAVETKQGLSDETLEYAVINAAGEGQTKLARVILEECHLELGGSPPSYTDGALHTAIRNGDHEMVKLLMKHGADNSETSGFDFEEGEHAGYGRTALQAAAARGHLRIVELLVDVYEIDPDDEGEVGTPLYLAAKGGHVPVVDSLLKAGASSLDVTMEEELPILHLV